MSMIALLTELLSQWRFVTRYITIDKKLMSSVGLLFKAYRKADWVSGLIAAEQLTSGNNYVTKRSAANNEWIWHRN